MKTSELIIPLEKSRATRLAIHTCRICDLKVHLVIIYLYAPKLQWNSTMNS